MSIPAKIGLVILVIIVILLVSFAISYITFGRKVAGEVEEPIDSGSAKATISWQGLSASALFYFDDKGALTNFVAERYMTVDDGYSLNELQKCYSMRVLSDVVY